MKKCFGMIAAAVGLFVMANVAYALDLQALKVHFLKGDYKAAIVEGERVLATANKHSAKLDELYYYLGISYLKEGNLLRAADIFDIILKEFPRSAFTEQSVIGLIDYDIAQKDYKAAVSKSQEFLKLYPKSKFRLEVQERLKQCEAKTQTVAVVPASTDSGQVNNLVSQALAGNPAPAGHVYVVQVGAFSNKANAAKLEDRLKAKGYTVFIAEALSNGKTLFKVRVGTFKTREEARQQEAVLKKMGYSTKILP